MKSELARMSRKYWRKLIGWDRRLAHLPAEGTRRGRVLLSYILDPLLAPGDLPNTHTHFWETLTIARSYNLLGFDVDGISWTNRAFEPTADYDAVIDVRLNLERLGPRVGSALKIFHSDTCHWRVNNAAQAERQERLEERRGVKLERHKLVEENRGAETADVICYLGNDFTRASFEFAGKPLERIPVSVPLTYEWPADKDWQSARRRFLWFGSGGLVHKGLDLVLEVFAQLPELHLTVCGPIHRERDFEALYRRELYELPNIETRGWIDVASEEFLELCRRTGALVYPSCAEGGGSSALTCMHAGLVPMLTDSASVDLSPETGIRIEGDIAAIRTAVLELSERAPRELDSMARAAWSWARQHHTREVFTQRYLELASTLMETLS